MKPLRHEWKILVPFDPREAMKVHVAAAAASTCKRTIRNWCDQHGIGRKIAGRYAISRVALAMHMDGDAAALEAYRGGDRTGPLVAPYFARMKT